MPVVPLPDEYDLWLDPGMTHTASAVDLLKPCDATLMSGYPVSARVNAVTNDDAEMFTGRRDPPNRSVSLRLTRSDIARPIDGLVSVWFELNDS
jgi:hypothetical protein